MLGRDGRDGGGGGAFAVSRGGIRVPIAALALCVGVFVVSQGVILLAVWQYCVAGAAVSSVPTQGVMPGLVQRAGFDAVGGWPATLGQQQQGAMAPPQQYGGAPGPVWPSQAGGPGTIGAANNAPDAWAAQSPVVAASPAFAQPPQQQARGPAPSLADSQGWAVQSTASTRKLRGDAGGDALGVVADGAGDPVAAWGADALATSAAPVTGGPPSPAPAAPAGAGSVDGPVSASGLVGGGAVAAVPSRDAAGSVRLGGGDGKADKVASAGAGPGAGGTGGGDPWGGAWDDGAVTGVSTTKKPTTPAVLAVATSGATPAAKMTAHEAKGALARTAGGAADDVADMAKKAAGWAAPSLAAAAQWAAPELADNVGKAVGDAAAAVGLADPDPPLDAAEVDVEDEDFVAALRARDAAEDAKHVGERSYEEMVDINEHGLSGWATARYQDKCSVAEEAETLAHESPIAKDIDMAIVVPTVRRKPPKPKRNIHTVGSQMMSGVMWQLHKYADVDGHDLEHHQGQSAASLALKCVAVPGCTAFNTAGWLKNVSDGAKVSSASGADLYVRPSTTVEKIPPPKRITQADIDYVIGTVQSMVEELDECRSPVFGLKYQIVVINNDPIGSGDKKGNVRVEEAAQGRANHEAYFTVKETYGHLPCVVFVDDIPAPWRYVVEYTPPKKDKDLTIKAERMLQQVSLISDVQYVMAHTHHADVMLWEDDCYVCPHAFQVVSGARRALADSIDKDWAQLRIGNGGSGLVLARPYIPEMLDYIKLFAPLAHVDVNTWRYANDFRRSEYISKQSFSAHQGTISAFKGYRWGEVECGNALDYWWGSYKDCDDLQMAEWRCQNGTVPTK